MREGLGGVPPLKRRGSQVEILVDFSALASPETKMTHLPIIAKKSG